MDCLVLSASVKASINAKITDINRMICETINNIPAPGQCCTLNVKLTRITAIVTVTIIPFDFSRPLFRRGVPFTRNISRNTMPTNAPSVINIPAPGQWKFLKTIPAKKIIAEIRLIDKLLFFITGFLVKLILRGKIFLLCI